MKKKAIQFLNILQNILSVLFIIVIFVGGATLVYLFANGYSFSITDNTIRKTGIINIETKPTGARIFINGADKGETSKIINYIEEGIVTVKITKDGYYDIEKQIKVVSEKSTPIVLKMVRKDPIKTTIFESKNKIVTKINSEYGNRFLLIEKTNDGLIEIHRVDTSRNFWDFSPNPTLIYTTLNKNINLELLTNSDDGKYLILKETTNTENIETKKIKTTIKYIIINTDKTSNNYSDIEIDRYINTHKIYWTENNSHLVLESTDEIISYDIDTNAKSILFNSSNNNDKKVVWNIDSENNFYLATKQEIDGKKSFKIDQYNINGGNRKTILNNIYYKTEQEYIDNLTEIDQEYKQFTLSPESTLFVGAIENITILPELKGIYMKTENASYWYDNRSEKYVLLLNQPSDLINELGNEQSLILKTKENKYFVYNIYKEESDPITELGIKEITNIPTGSTNVKWENGQIISFSDEKQEKQYIVDKENENLININKAGTEIKTTLWRTNPALDEMYTIEELTDSYRVIKYQI